MLDIFLAGHNTFSCWGRQQFEVLSYKANLYDENVYVTSMTRRATKGLKNKAKTIHLFAGIGDCHSPNKVFCVFQVLSENLKR